VTFGDTPSSSSRPPAPSRRDALALTAGTLAALALPAGAQAQSVTQQAITATLGEGQRFDPALVLDIARVIARRPFQAPANDLPEPFNNLNYEQYIAIRAQASAVLWSGEARGFAIEPLHRGFIFGQGLSLHIVEDGLVRRIGYDRGKFDFGRLNPAATLPDIGFSGFRIFAAGGNEPAREVAVFQGATFFRAIANGQSFGAMARGLTLRPAEARGEEFPVFRAFWIERPIAGSGTLVMHGLMDSESCCGAFRFTLRPGDVTIVDVEATIIPRAPLEHVGLGGMASTFLFAPHSRRIGDDVRPAVHESLGLQMLNGRGEWIWRPLNNPETLQISVFADQSPKGFGLLQRERDHTVFQDDDQQFQRRPSLWIEPLGDWGQGAVQLLEIPSDSEVNDNILAYWRPRQPLAPGTEWAFALRQYWCWEPPERPALAIVRGSRIGRAPGGPRRRRFMVDFVGDGLADAGRIVELKPILSATPGALTNIRVWPYPERKTVRIGFDLDPGNEASVELRLLLEAAGKPASETWLYRWTA
jgi:glucans biosynthesis protein